MSKEIEFSEFTRMYSEWADSFMKQKQVPMDKAMSMVFISCSLNEGYDAFPGKEMEASFQYRIVSSRADFAGLVATKSVLTVLAALSASPGDAVMYVHALAKYQHKMKLAQLDMQALSVAFPIGYPERDSLEKLWDMQKLYSGGNMLDLAHSGTLGG